MPRIRIFEQDNTGAEYTGGETVVFVPGSLEIQEDKNKKSLADDNNCIYISTADYNNLKKFLKIADKDLTSGQDKEPEIKKKTLAFVQACLSHNMDVIYCYVKDFGTDVPVGTISGVSWTGSKETDEDTLPKETIKLPGRTINNQMDDKGNHIFGYKIDLDFLQDKDNYNIKFLTTGCLNAISCTLDPDDILQDSNSNVNAKFDFSVANALTKLAFDRKDCAALLSVDYDTSKVKNGNVFAGQLSNAINNAINEVEDERSEGINIQKGKGLTTTEGQESYGAIFLPNFRTTLSVGTETLETTMPSVWGYLIKYGTCLGNGQEWLPIANSTRGSVESLGITDLTVTKYYMDLNIIKDTNGSSFNGIVNLRPYGNVIWGDRTLLKLANTVKATAYLSLRMLICDVSKRAYQSAIRNTYESNNDITWFNFKSRITDLLGEMVAAGVLSNYSITKLPADSYNTIICRITLYPNLPVENFDIYINLENAEVTPADTDNEKEN